MRQKRSNSESRDKGVGAADKPLTRGQAKEAMARFESLTRRLLTVTRQQIQDEQERYEKRKRQRKPINRAFDLRRIHFHSMLSCPHPVRIDGERTKLYRGMVTWKTQRSQMRTSAPGTAGQGLA
jgi:hypothetical protein